MKFRLLAVFFAAAGLSCSCTEDQVPSEVVDYIDEYEMDVDDMDELDDYIDEPVYVFGEVDGDEIYATLVVIGI